MKRFFVLFAIFLIPLVFPFFQASAQENVMRANANVEYNQQTHTQSAVIELLVSFSCLLTGVDPVDPNSLCLGVDPVSRKLGYVPAQNGGITGVFAGMIGKMYYIPISSHDYVAYQSEKFGFADKTYAQVDEDQGEAAPELGDPNPVEATEGVGFSALRPVIPMWEVFRNIVFVFFVIAFILIGFAMMFRINVGGSAMTIQSALPKIVIVLLLVALSYPIAGFMIDMMYILMYFIFNIFNSVPGVDINIGIMQSRTPLDAAGSIGGIGSIAGNASLGVGEVIASVFDGNGGRFIAGLLGGIVGSLAFPGPGSIIGGIIGAGFGGNLLGYLGTIIAFVVFGLALGITLFKIWFELLKAFVSVLIGAVLAPIWIAASIIPATPFPATSWFRFMAGNLLMFPAALAMFLFAFVFLELFGGAPVEETIAFPFVGNPTDLGAFGSLIAFGVLMLTPNVIKKVKDAVGTPSGEVFSGVVGGVGAGAGAAKWLIGKPVGRLVGYNEHGHMRPLQQKLMSSRLAKIRVGQGPIGTFLSKTPLQRDAAKRGQGFGPRAGEVDVHTKDGTIEEGKGGFQIGRNIVGGVLPKPKKSNH